MTKTELISVTAEKTGLTKKDAELAVNTALETITAALDVITEALAEQDKVQLVGFGAFEVKSRAARLGRNPKTKETIEIPASTSVAFKASKTLKDSVAK